VLIAEPYTSASLVEQVAARSGARIARLAPSVGADPEARDYIGLIDLDVKRLVDAFSGR